MNLMNLTENEQQIQKLWEAYWASPDSELAVAILKMIVSIDRKDNQNE